MSWILPLCAGAATGILSGFGVGGGTLLLIYMTTFAGLGQQLAQGINLLYFLPTAGAALPCHLKNGYVDKVAAKSAILTGLVANAAAAWAATSMNTELLHKCFGLFLLYIGVRELFRKAPKERD